MYIYNTKSIQPRSFTFFPPFIPNNLPTGHRGMDPKVQLEGGAKHLMMKEVCLKTSVDDGG